jgi:hypothetical protein
MLKERDLDGLVAHAQVIAPQSHLGQGKQEAGDKPEAACQERPVSMVVEQKMSRHSRKPPGIILGTALGIALVYLASGAGVGPGTSRSSWTLSQLEAAIVEAGTKSEIWKLYAGQLTQHNRHADAALAYKRVLELEPYDRQAMLQCALALAAAKNNDELYVFVSHLVVTEPKVAVDILERPQFGPCLSEGRFQSLQIEARNQAMD